MERNSFWWRLVHLNPVLFRSAVVAVVTLLGSVGVLVSPAIPDALVTVVTTVGALVAALWSRDGVVPEAKVVVYQPDPVEMPTKVFPGEATAEAATDRAIVTAARAAPVE